MVSLAFYSLCLAASTFASLIRRVSHAFRHESNYISVKLEIRRYALPMFGVRERRKRRFLRLIRHADFHVHTIGIPRLIVSTVC